MLLTIQEVDDKYLPYVSGDVESVNSFISEVEYLEEVRYRELDNMNYHNELEVAWEILEMMKNPKLFEMQRAKEYETMAQ